jgi:ribonuclease J
MQHNSQIAERLGILKLKPGVEIRDSDVRDYARDEVVCLCTGSQGEPQAALPRIAIDDHRFVSLEKGDTVAFSARSIPATRRPSPGS